MDKLNAKEMTKSGKINKVIDKKNSIAMKKKYITYIISYAKRDNNIQEENILTPQVTPQVKIFRRVRGFSPLCTPGPFNYHSALAWIFTVAKPSHHSRSVVFIFQ